jgi:hypothetical protein
MNNEKKHKHMNYWGTIVLACDKCIALTTETTLGQLQRLPKQPLHKKLKSETYIGDARKGDHLRSGKMRRVCISEDRNWLGGEQKETIYFLACLG